MKKYRFTILFSFLFVAGVFLSYNYLPVGVCVFSFIFYLFALDAYDSESRKYVKG